MKPNLFEELSWRGMVYDKTEGVEKVVTEEKLNAYIGFDPTASSLHVGSLLPIMGLVHLQRHGHTPIALVGGATGMIGDPSGKSAERTLLSKADLDQNLAGIRAQLESFLDFETNVNPAKVVNNYDWIGPMSFVDFMRDVGKHFSVNVMLSKESVKRRIGGQGISFTEFSYSLLQAYDFYHLSQSHNCTLQMGGSDQWGNITAGCDLIRRLSDKKANGIVFPLVTSASGTKFGKTEAGTVWLDPEMTSPYRFYQFWMNTVDDDALKYLKLFTLLEQEEVEELAAMQAEAPHKRDVQRRLAEDVTGRVHGQTALDKAVQASKVMFGGNLDGLSAADIGDIFADLPSTELPADRFQGEGFPVLELFTACGVTKSNGEARRLLQGGGVNVNNVRVNDVQHKVTMDDAVEGKFIVLRKGGKSYHLVRILT